MEWIAGAADDPKDAPSMKYVALLLALTALRFSVADACGGHGVVANKACRNTERHTSDRILSMVYLACVRCAAM